MGRETKSTAAAGVTWGAGGSNKLNELRLGGRLNLGCGILHRLTPKEAQVNN